MSHKRHEISEQELSYFELQAYWGATKHAGALKSTKELTGLCHIEEDNHILEVGCGVGTTTCYIAKTIGCKVTGIDISEKMINWSNQRAQKESIKNKVKFQVANAQNLPFEDSSFDAVIGESVTSFLNDKHKGIKEYTRVTKPGGYVGLNEMTWIKTPPPTELVEYYYRTTGCKPETSENWKKLLEASGLKNVTVRNYKLDIVNDFIDRIRRIGSEDFSRALYRFLSLSISSLEFRKYMKETLPPLSVTKDILKFLGYGIYVGTK